MFLAATALFLGCGSILPEADLLAPRLIPCCFSSPDGVDDKVYIGKGLNWKVKKGKEYKGAEADVAEFNDNFMKGEMALDTDGTWPSCS